MNLTDPMMASAESGATETREGRNALNIDLGEGGQGPYRLKGAINIPACANRKAARQAGVKPRDFESAGRKTCGSLRGQ